MDSEYDPIEIYRNNIIGALVSSLQDTYKAIFNLIGEDCFLYHARNYAVTHPSKEPTIYKYGEKFSNFLSKQESLRSLLYLSDLAILEYKIGQILISKDVQPVALSDFQRFNINDYDKLNFEIAKNCFLLHSIYPVDLLFNLARGLDPLIVPESINLNQEVFLLIFYKNNKLTISRIEYDEFYILNMFKDYKDISVVSHYSYKAGVNLVDAMPELLQKGCFSKCYIPQF